MGDTPNIMRPARFSLAPFIEYLKPWPLLGVMVEVGCYQGESTEAFAKSGKFSRIYAIDPWSNETYDPNDKATLHCDMGIVEEAFDARLSQYPAVVKLKMTGEEAVKKFQDNTVGLVYIDANHRYEAVKKDILAWLPKVWNGGGISGHDYGTHPGVKDAVDEIFGRPKKVFPDYSWLVAK